MPSAVNTTLLLIKNIPDTMQNQIQNILSRCLIIAEDSGGRTDNIASVEKLIIERAEIQFLLLKTKEVYRNISTRRGQAGKDLPQWGKADFERRFSDIKNELLRNARDLEKEFEQLFEAIRSQRPSDIIYH